MASETILINTELQKAIKKLNALNIPKYNRYDLQAYNYKVVQYSTFNGLIVDAIIISYDCYAMPTRGTAQLETIKKAINKYKNLVICHESFNSFVIMEKSDFIAYSLQAETEKQENENFIQWRHAFISRYGVENVKAC